MTPAATLELLRALAVFPELDAAELEVLAAATTARAVAGGEVIVREGAPGESLFVVGAGEVAVSRRADGREIPIATLGPGAMFGEMLVVTGGKRSATVTALGPGTLLELDQAALASAAAEAPALVDRLTRLARQRLLDNLLDAALVRALGPLDRPTRAALRARFDWVTLRSGEALFHQGDAGTAWYVVASGRLEIVQTGADGVERVLGELGRGESLGEIALLSRSPRTATPIALRDTTVARLSAEAFQELLGRHPAALRAIIEVLVERTVASAGAGPRAPDGETIALVPLHPGVDVAAFAQRLATALAPHGAAVAVSAARLLELGVMTSVPADDHPAWLRFSAWLDERAETERFVLLACDAAATAWSRRALREADHVLLVGDATAAPAPGAYERELLERPGPHQPRRSLVLLHPAVTTLPSGTAAWLEARAVHDHLHVRIDRDGDVARLARVVAGRATSLVLGAGGARGFAHIGVIRALAETGVAVDHVGGTSSGALIGAMLAMGWPAEQLVAETRRMAAMSPFALWRFTLPVTSLFDARGLEAALAAVFGETRIEDLWIPFFCTSCDLSAFADCVHDRGELARLLRATTSLPGVLPPQVLDGHLHVDGGVTQPLPGAAMRRRSRGLLIAVDVSDERVVEVPLPRYPTGWRALWRRLRRRDVPALPGIAELFVRAAGVGAVGSTAAAARDADLLLRPPLAGFGTLDADALDEIEAIGYHHARERLEAPGVLDRLGARRAD